MIKYDETIENLENFTITLVDEKPKKEIEIKNPQLSISFLEQYNELLKELSHIDIFLKHFSTSQFVDVKWHSDIEYTICEYVSPSPTLLMRLNDRIMDLFKFKERFYKKYSKVAQDELYNSDDYEEIEFLFKRQTDIEIYNYSNILKELKMYDDILEDLCCVDLDYVKRFSDVHKKIKSLINEIEINSTIVYEINPIQQFKLPNSWYITPYGDLYNTFITENSLFFDFSDPSIDSTNLGRIDRVYQDYVFNGHIVKKGEDLEEHHKNNLLFLKEKEQEFLNERNNIINCGIVKASILSYFDVRGYQFPLIKDDIFIKGEDVTFDSNVKKLVIGLLGAKAILFKFLRNLDEYTSCSQIENVYSYSSFKAQNFLVRCLGFHRISSDEERTIITSSINFEQELKEYIEKGWNIKYIPPIIIDKEKKNICESELLLDKVKTYKNNKINNKIS